MSLRVLRQHTRRLVPLFKSALLTRKEVLCPEPSIPFAFAFWSWWGHVPSGPGRLEPPEVTGPQGHAGAAPGATRRSGHGVPRVSRARSCAARRRPGTVCSLLGVPEPLSCSPVPASLPRNNLSQWEKVIRGEESALWISAQPAAPGASEKLPVKMDD